MHMEWYNREKVNQWHRYGIIIKQPQMPNWSAPLQRARRDDQNGYIICLLWSLDGRDMHKISCGPGGTHTRPHGDVLPHKSPHVHDTSSIQGNTQSTNQEPVHGSKGPLPHGNGLKTLQTPPYPPGSHQDERQRKRSWPRISRPHRLSHPTLRRFTPIFHVSSPHWILRVLSGCLGCPHEVVQPL
jgi:hypothetical protein